MRRLLLWLLGSLLQGGGALAATECARPGDLVIYRAPNMAGQFMISHTATVAEMQGCSLRQVHIHLQGEQGASGCRGATAAGTTVQLDPDAPALLRSVGGEADWVVLHSDRQPDGHRLKRLREARIGQARQRVMLYATDKGRPIVGLPVRSGAPANCHGLVFANGEAAIIGWGADGRWHVDGALQDQARAVQIVLDDNGYRKVHALDRHGVDHF